MTDTTRDLLVRGIAAAKSGGKKEAEFFLEWLLRLEPTLEDKKEAWFWLSEVASGPKEKRALLEEILANDLWDARARRALAILDGKLKPEEIVDPNATPAAGDGQPQSGRAQRFVCPTCGGRMTYAPNGQSLICEYCALHQKVTAPSKEPGAQTSSGNFIVGMATARGHLKPVVVHEILCQGCGATFLMPAVQISNICPYCQSAYILDQRSTREIFTPNTIIPFQLDENQAKQALKNWFAGITFDQRPKVRPGMGVYFPMWLFDVGGHLLIRYEVEKDEKWYKRTDEPVIQVQNVRVSASTHLPEAFQSLLDSFILEDRCEYDDRYLSNWIAETYQVSMSDASLTARERAIDDSKPRAKEFLEEPNRDISFSTAGIQIEAYQLSLVPVWVTRFSDGNREYGIWVNGQTGEVFSDYQANNPSWLERLFQL